MRRHYIYVIGREEGPVKVGITSYPGGRLSTIQTGCPFRIAILHLRECRDRSHALKNEADFHAVYAQNRMVGEWFDLDSDLAIEGVDMPFDIEEYTRTDEYKSFLAERLAHGSHQNH